MARLREVSPELTCLTPGQQRRVILLAHQHAAGINRHWIYPSACPLPWRLLAKSFPHGRFESFNEAAKWFTVGTKYSSDAGFARPYWLDHAGVQGALASWYASAPPRHMTDAMGHHRRTPPRAILSKDENGVTRKTRGQLRSSLIGINTEALQALRVALNRPEDAPFRHQITALLNEARIIEGPDHLVLQYRESASGRLIGLGHHLQSLPRWLRRTALVGQWDLDVNACHFAILLGVAWLGGERLPTLERAVIEKEGFRTGIANRHGVDIATVKTALTALGYGAPLSSSPRTAVGKLLGPRAEGFVQDAEVVSLQVDIRSAAATLRDRFSRNRRGRVVNILGKSIATTKPASVTSHLITGYEARMLDTMLQAPGGDLSLLIHDGLVSPMELDTDELAKRAFHETGIRLTYRQERIIQPSTDEIRQLAPRIRRRAGETG